MKMKFSDRLIKAVHSVFYSTSAIGRMATNHDLKLLEELRAIGEKVWTPHELTEFFGQRRIGLAEGFQSRHWQAKKAKRLHHEAQTEYFEFCREEYGECERCGCALIPVEGRPTCEICGIGYAVRGSKPRYREPQERWVGFLVEN